MDPSDSEQDSWTNIESQRDRSVSWSWTNDDKDAGSLFEGSNLEDRVTTEEPSYVPSFVTSVDTSIDITPSIASVDTSVVTSANITSSAAVPCMHHIREMNKRIRLILAEEGCSGYKKDTNNEEELCNLFRKAIIMRQKRIERVFNGISFAGNVDLCFLIDITGSMQKHFEATKEAVFKIVNTLVSERDQENSIAKLRIGLVGYRDFNDEKQFEILPFTESVQEFHDFCGSIVTTGGGDPAEDIFGGLEKVVEMAWDLHNSGTRLVFHICDSPCHGSEYHAPNVNDFHMKGDPKGRTHQNLFKKLSDADIQYHFGKINDTTDMMLKKFEDGMAEEISMFDIKNVKDICSSVILAVLDSVSSSIRTSIARGGDDKKRLSEHKYAYQKDEPDWTRIKRVEGVFLSYNPPKSISDIVEGVPLERNHPENCLVQISESPFAKGVERVAFYGRDLIKGLFYRRSSPPTHHDVVFKEYIHNHLGKMKTRFERANQLQTVVAFLAKKFCEELAEKTGERKVIEVLKSKTFVAKDENGHVRYMSCEKRFDPSVKFIRFTNNVKYTILESKAEEYGVSPETIELLMAFSHWTYEVTSGFLMVVDLQGIVHKDDNNTKIVLTDPGIHCSDTTRYGCMNLGEDGMQMFITRHSCSRFCTGLGLSDEENH